MPASSPDPALTPPAADDPTPLTADSASPRVADTPEERDDLTLDERNRDTRLAEQDPHEPESTASEDRSRVLADGFTSLSRWSLRVSIVIVTFYLVWRALTPFWVIILPLILGLIISTVLWPPAAWLRSKGLGPALAALATVLGALAVIGGVIAAIVPTVADETPELVRKSTQGVSQVQEWLQGPPLKIPPAQIDNAVTTINERIKTSGEAIASAAEQPQHHAVVLARLADDLDRDGRHDLDDARLVCEAVDRVERAHPELVGGCGHYPGNGAHGPFTHIDARGYRARWVGSGDGG